MDFRSAEDRGFSGGWIIFAGCLALAFSSEVNENFLCLKFSFAARFRIGLYLFGEPFVFGLHGLSSPSGW